METADILSDQLVATMEPMHFVTDSVHEHVTKECNRGRDMRAQQMNIYVMAVFYTTVFLISFIGNATVVYVMVIRAKTTNVMNLLITNLAVSDFLVCITSLWLTPLYWYTGQWMWGTTMCHFFPLFQGLSICNSSMTLLVIAVDRYIVVCKNQDSRYKAFNLTTKNCKFVIAFIWSIAITLVMPYALNMKIKKSSNLCGHYKCLESWSTGSTRAVYGLVVTMFQFIIPMIFIGFSYMKIFMFLQRQCQESNNRLRVVSNKKNALFRMLFVMVVAFAVCWLPVNILNVMRDIGLDHLLGRQFGIWFMRAHMLSMTGVMVNPLIYAFMNHNFRDEFCRVFPIRVFIALPKRICRKSPAKKETGLLNVEQNTTGLLTNNTRAITDDGSQKRGLFSYYDDEFDDLGRDDGFWTDEDENQNKLSLNTPRRKRSRYSERTENEVAGSAAATGCCSSCNPKNDEPYAKSLEMQKHEEKGNVPSATRTTTSGTPNLTEEKNSATVVAISTEPCNPSTEALSIRRTLEMNSTTQSNQHSAPPEFDVHSDVQL